MRANGRLWAQRGATPCWVLAPLLALALLLAGCGGGGGSGATASPGSALRAPTASFVVSTTAPVSLTAVGFDGSGSTDSDGQVDLFEWDFGDGTTARGRSVNHIYQGAGNYQVSLTVTDNQGLSARTSRALAVGGNFAPIAAFDTDRTRGQVPLTVVFDAANASDSDGTIASYVWDFGNGAGGVGVATQHTYTIAGTFTAELTVTDNSGSVAKRRVTITVDPAVGNFTAGGTIAILASTAVDGDVNDLNAARSTNDTTATAQRIPNPVAVGGYVNVPNNGPNGAQRTSGDLADTYSVALAGRETLMLTIGDPDPLANDLDLVLYDATGTELVRSEGVDSTERVTAPVAGNYFVQVVPFSGASTYVLTLGQLASGTLGGTNTRVGEVTSATPFVPGEVIVEYAANAAGVKAASTLRGLGATTVAGSGNGGPQLLRMEPATMLRALGADGTHIAAAEASSKAGTALLAKLLARQGGVRSVDLNYLRQPSATPNDSLFRLQWHLRDIGLPQAWDITTGSRNVIVAVIDTGIRAEHPDLQGNVIDGYDFISDTDRARDGNGADTNPTDPGDLAVGSSSSFHGTHVAGTVGARTDNGTGVAGVAWDVSLMPLRVLGRGGGTSFDLIQAIRYSARLSNATGALPARRADIVNMSLGGGAFSQSEQNAITAARNAGVILIAAAGNENSMLPSYPASYAGVVSVSASTISRNKAGYSNSGPNIDISAPGGNNASDLNGDGVGDGVVSTIADDSSDTLRLGFTSYNGTSMAAPHVAGVAALMKTVLPALTPALFDSELISGRLSDDVGAGGRDDQFGYGIVNANKAVARARALADQVSGGSIALLLASPASLSFGATQTQQNLDVANVGDGALRVTRTSSNQPWLTIAPGSVDTNGLGPYVVRVNRSGLAEGSYSGVLTLESSVNTLIANVTMEVRSVAIDSNAGLHYVLMVDRSTGQTRASAQVNASNAQYAFSIPNVPAGTYDVVAGTDANNDGFICDSGEACGVFGDIDSPQQVILSQDRNDLNFTSGFRTTLDANALDGQAFSITPGGQPKAVR